MKKVLFGLSLLALPAVALAQVTTFRGLLVQFNSILNLLTIFIVSLAVFIIIFGIFKYIAGAGDEEKRKEARSFIIWGIVGVFLMLSVWGLVRLLATTVNLGQNAPVPPNPPLGLPLMPPVSN